MAVHLIRLSIALIVLVTAIAITLLSDSTNVAQLCRYLRFDVPFANWQRSAIYEKKRDALSLRISTWTGIKPTSAWCWTSSGASWQAFRETHCRFESLCLKLDSGEFIFAFDANRSTFYPASLRYVANKVEFGRLSPVMDHNLYGVENVVTVAHSRMDSMGRPMYYIPAQTIIMSRFKPDNLMHLIHDDLLPLFVTFRQLGIDVLRGTVFVDDKWDSTSGRQLFQTIFPTVLHQSDFPSDSIVCFENAHIGLMNTTIWYQYGFVKPQGAVARTSEETAYIRQIIRLFRERIVSTFNLDATCKTMHALLFVRSSNRRILNANDFFIILQQRHFSDLRLFTLNPDDMSDAQKIRNLLQAVLCAHTLIGVHGSEHILSLLMAPTDEHNVPISVIELFPYGIEPSQYTPFKVLANILGHGYYVWTNNIRKNAVFHADDYPPEWGGLSHLDAAERHRIEQNVDKAEPLQPHLCCDNPAWLYRIYQDTMIDLDQFDHFLRHNLKDFPVKEDDNILQPDIFRLSEVSNMSCLLSHSMVTISWSLPWNFALHFGNNTFQLKYQVLIQTLNSQEVLLWESDHEHISVNQTHCSPAVGCNVWVKPHLSQTIAAVKPHIQVMGFFNRIPFVCTV